MLRRGIKIAHEKFLVFALFSFFLLFYCKLVSSDEVSNSRISLSEAIKIFKEKNYDVKIAAYEIKKSEGAYIQAGLLLNPALSINYTGLSFGKNLIYDTDNTLLSARFEQPLELGGKRRLRRLSAFYQLRAVDFQTKEISRELVVGLITSYFRALADRLYAEYLRRDIDDFDEILKIQEKRQKEGFLSLIDFMKLQLYKLELENALTQAVSTYKKSLKDFNFFLGGGNYEPEEVQEPQDEIFVENLIQDSVEKREILKSLKEQEKSVDYKIRLLKAYSIPDISLGVEYDSFGGSFKYKPGIGFGVFVSLPIFDRRQGDLISAISEREQISATLKREEERIKKEILQAFDDYQASKNIYFSYAEKKSIMDELLERTKKAHSIGGISTIEFIDTLRTYRAFMSAFFRAKYQYIASYYILKILGGAEF